MSRPDARDLASLLALFAMAACLSFWLSSIWPAVLADRAADAPNVWFQADAARVYENVTQRWSDHYRTKVHPLFSVATNPLAFVLTKAGVSPWTAMRILLSLASGLLAGLIYSVARLIGLRRLDAGLTCWLLLASSSFVFWAGVPETFIFGSVTMAAVLAISAVALHVRLRPWWFVLATIVGLSVTITNVSLAVAAAWANLRWRRAARVLADGLLITIMIWAIQKYVYPSAGFFLGDREEARYALMAGSAGPLQRLLTMFGTSFLIQGIDFRPNPDTALWPLLSIEHARLSGASLLQFVGLAIWSMALAVGSVAIVRTRRLGSFRWVLGAGLAFQVLLHVIYGDETFLYSAHWMPLLALLAGASLLRFPVWWWRVGLLALVAGVAANNLTAFADVSLRLSTAVPERAQVLLEQARRPTDPWPRGSGHALLARVGMPLEDRGWLEAGGSFSPALRSFGVSIWVFDAETGQRLATSDDIDLSSTKHAWVDLPDSQVAVLVETPFYRLRWATVKAGGYDLTLESTVPERHRLEVVTRSVGPAGGPLPQIDWDGASVQVGNDWRVQPPEGAAVMLADEQFPDWASAERFSLSGRQMVASESGWAAARIRVSSPRAGIQLRPIPESPGAVGPRQPVPVRFLAEGVPERLDSLLRGNVHNLLAGLVDGQSRPGDPVNYPFQWLRDSAYVVVALARSGEILVARSLTHNLAVADFFGGFGAEADAPGLALWAMSETSMAAEDPKFDEEMWPHVVRKVEIIERMVNAVAPMHASFSGPLVPGLPKSADPTLVSIPSRDGLVHGRMDNNFRPFYVTASAIGGLSSAAKMASRAGRSAEALAWRDDAEKLRASYRAAMRQASPNDPRFRDDRTYINAIYPFEAAEKSVLHRALDSWSVTKRRPVHQTLWTYFGLAIAHQWLRLERPEHAVETLEYFARRDRVPGLWVLWEGDDEENSSGGWLTIRGNVAPKGVTPHYWSAAEAQLLALAMLAYADSEDQTLVVGAGLQSADLQRPILVRGLSTGLGSVCWRWDGKRRLAIGGSIAGLRVRMGEGFPANSEVVQNVDCDRLIESSAVPTN